MMAFSSNCSGLSFSFIRENRLVNISAADERR
jgi:hypothetical protein